MCRKVGGVWYFDAVLGSLLGDIKAEVGTGGTSEIAPRPLGDLTEGESGPGMKPFLRSRAYGEVADLV
jgi:hypothetical protein